MAVRLGKQTIALEAPVSIVNTATVVGTKESEGRWLHILMFI